MIPYDYQDNCELTMSLIIGMAPYLVKEVTDFLYDNGKRHSLLKIKCASSDGLLKSGKTETNKKTKSKKRKI